MNRKEVVNRICKIINNNQYSKTDVEINRKMNILKIKDRRAIPFASECLEQGQVIALPTDTIYGLACSANCSKTIQRLYSIKCRDINKPLAICVANLSSLRYWGQADHLSDGLLQQLLPGPFTIVLVKSSNLDNPHLNPGIEKIGIRIPNFRFIQDLCEKFGQPLALTSANKSNETSSLCIEEFKDLWSYLGAVFDGGKISMNEKSRAGSTVIDLSVPGKCKVLRKGVAYSKTLSVMNEFSISVE